MINIFENFKNKKREGFDGVVSDILEFVNENYKKENILKYENMILLFPKHIIKWMRYYNFIKLNINRNIEMTDEGLKMYLKYVKNEFL